MLSIVEFFIRKLVEWECTTPTVALDMIDSFVLVKIF